MKWRSVRDLLALAVAGWRSDWFFSLGANKSLFCGFWRHINLKKCDWFQIYKKHFAEYLGTSRGLSGLDSPPLNQYMQYMLKLLSAVCTVNLPLSHYYIIPGNPAIADGQTGRKPQDDCQRGSASWRRRIQPPNTMWNHTGGGGQACSKMKEVMSGEGKRSRAFLDAETRAFVPDAPVRVND